MTKQGNRMKLRYSFLKLKLKRMWLSAFYQVKKSFEYVGATFHGDFSGLFNTLQTVPRRGATESVVAFKVIFNYLLSRNSVRFCTTDWFRKKENRRPDFLVGLHIGHL